MATALARFRIPLLLGHTTAGHHHRILDARRIHVSASDSFDCPSVTSFSASTSSSLLSPRCGCSAVGLPTLPSLLGSVGARQQQNFLSLPLSRGSLFGWKTKKALRNSVMVTKAGMKLDPGGGGGGGGEGGNGIGRVIVNLALAGGLTYLTVTGKLGWVFDTIISLWLLAALLPIVGVIAFFWFAEREIVTGACPNCGESFQVFEFVVKEEPQLCPYCSQPFKLENGRFIRDEPRFSNRRANSGPFSGGFKSPFGTGFGRDTTTSSRKDESRDPGGIIVDVEAEVRDRD